MPYLQRNLDSKKERKYFLSEAESRFLKEKPSHGSLSEYKDLLYRHRFTYDEYMNRWETYTRPIPVLAKG